MLFNNMFWVAVGFGSGTTCAAGTVFRTVNPAGTACADAGLGEGAGVAGVAAVAVTGVETTSIYESIVGSSSVASTGVAICAGCDSLGGTVGAYADTGGSVCTAGAAVCAGYASSGCAAVVGEWANCPICAGCVAAVDAFLGSASGACFGNTADACSVVQCCVTATGEEASCAADVAVFTDLEGVAGACVDGNVAVDASLGLAYSAGFGGATDRSSGGSVCAASVVTTIATFGASYVYGGAGCAGSGVAVGFGFGAACAVGVISGTANLVGVAYKGTGGSMSAAGVAVCAGCASPSCVAATGEGAGCAASVAVFTDFEGAARAFVDGNQMKSFNPIVASVATVGVSFVVIVGAAGCAGSGVTVGFRSSAACTAGAISGITNLVGPANPIGTANPTGAGLGKVVGVAAVAAVAVTSAMTTSIHESVASFSYVASASLAVCTSCGSLGCATIAGERAGIDGYAADVAVFTDFGAGATVCDGCASPGCTAAAAIYAGCASPGCVPATDCAGCAVSVVVFIDLEGAAKACVDGNVGVLSCAVVDASLGSASGASFSSAVDVKSFNPIVASVAIVGVSSVVVVGVAGYAGFEVAVGFGSSTACVAGAISGTANPVGRSLCFCRV
ncbi:hypothetical protein ACOSQ3_021912 [Xanthoceras sorbifolium]